MTTTLSASEIKLPQVGRMRGLLLALLLTGFSSQCFGGALPAAKNAPEASRNISFRKDVRPILDTYCTFCHFSASEHGQLSLEGGYTLRMLVNRPSVLSKYPRVVPGKPDESFLIHKMEGTHPGTGLRMPITALLDKEQIDLIRKWIAEGALDN